uniref:Uncharacterized protein n=1 Tax=Oryza sativa subsp. japonica TaxID=39947 RepID=Q75GR0_ORYSJ|nr:hypothetical protein [Oryza sativa Japonica Group]AAS07331.1 hypothetical protein [Oryza sativa Japonica Group]
MAVGRQSAQCGSGLREPRQCQANGERRPAREPATPAGEVVCGNMGRSRRRSGWTPSMAASRLGFTVSGGERGTREWQGKLPPSRRQPGTATSTRPLRAPPAAAVLPPAAKLPPHRAGLLSLRPLPRWAD